MRILFSISYAGNPPFVPGGYAGHEVDIVPRRSDWGKGGLRKYPHYAREALILEKQARDYDAVALFSVGMEAFLLSQMQKLLRRKTRLVCADFLIPRPSHLLKAVAAGLRRVDAFVCIRKGDMETLTRRFGIPPEKCTFAPFPCDRTAANIPTQERGYLYSAGWAHRDWPTLLCALEQTGEEAVLSVGGPLELPGTLCRHVRVLPQRSPAEGRLLMAGASLVALPLAETELPSGPLVLLDAMAMGKAIIVTDVNGSRDYATHGSNAWVVPPGDPGELARAITTLMRDPDLRRRLGNAARAHALRHFTSESFASKVIEACTIP